MLKTIFRWSIYLLLAVNLLIVFSGKTYLYKGVANTYIKGKKGPSIDEYQIFSNRKVEAGVAQPWTLSGNYNKPSLSGQDEDYMKKLETIAFLVVRNDSILYEKYWDGFSDSSHTNSFSMAKSIVSLLTGIAVDEGKIKSLDQRVGDFLPEFREGMSAKLTVRHLLTMSSGIDFDESYSSPFSFTAEAYYGSDLKSLYSRHKVVEEPGKVFNYLSGNTVLLGFLLKKATGMTLSEYASEKLWKPLGAEYPAYWNLDDENGMEKAYCCFISNARDFARLGQLCLDSGKWKGKQIVSEKYVMESVQPAPLVKSDGSGNDSYGYSWWILPSYKGNYIYYQRGILGQYIIVVPDKKLIIVRLGKLREEVQQNDHPLDLFHYIDAGLALAEGK